ncbi:transaldolase family protein [Streptomyces sp. ID05-04B]|uniref:transaldolase family protein n=1 Tax=Streptomyces sp. P3 TaxID=2135430 RepID=UPI000D21488E|nr:MULTISPECIES: transaldolase family protein [unclassified Streptomyces]AVV45595.1 hypothetical protein C6376_33800 [Streptomyces sp. P3]MDX5570333.1 transaldolase family protein [Streptomyces sp. ID05-04B]
MTEATATAGALRRPPGEGGSARPDGPSRRRIAYGGRRIAATGVRTGAGAGKDRRRPLWTSTGVKHPAYRDAPHGDDPVASGTADTRPGATPETAADHGVAPADTVTGSPAGTPAGLASAEAPGISTDDVVTRMEDEGVAEFEAAWRDVLDAVTKSPTSKGVDAE